MRILWIAAASAVFVIAQAPTALLSFIGEIKQNYTSIRNNLLRSAQAMPEEHYSFKPSPDVRDFGQEVAHAADLQTMLCSMALNDPKQGDAAAKKTKADLIAALEASNALCDKAYESLTDATASQARPFIRGQRTLAGVLDFNVAHDNETYGTMVPYMRMKGIVPPSSDNAGKGKAKAK